MWGKRSNLQCRIEQGVNTLNVVIFQMTVANLDFVKLKAQEVLCLAFEVALKQAIASEAGHGVTPECVALDYSAGSVVVNCAITPPGGVMATAVSLALRTRIEGFKGTLSEAFASKIASVTDIEQATRGTIQVAEVTIPTTKPYFYPNIKLPRNHGIPNGVFTLFEQLQILDDSCVSNEAQVEEVHAEEVAWSLFKCAELFKDKRLRRLFVQMVSSLQRNDRRSCNGWASSLAPNTLQFILSENPVKQAICSNSRGNPRGELLTYAAKCKMCVALAIVASDVLEHWTYDFSAQDKAFLGEALGRLDGWSNLPVAFARGLWDPNSCRYVVMSQALWTGAMSASNAAHLYLSRCPRTVLCSRFKAPWRGANVEESFFHLYPAFVEQSETSSAEILIDYLAQAHMHPSLELSSAIRAYIEDPDVKNASKRDVLLSFVSACRGLECSPPLLENARRCICFRTHRELRDDDESALPSTKDLELIGLETVVKDYTSRMAAKAGKTGDADAAADSDLAEMLEAILLLSIGDSLWTWAKRKQLEEPQIAKEAKRFLYTIGSRHVPSLMRAAAAGDGGFQYDDHRARELIDGTKLWMPSNRGGAYFSGDPQKQPREPEDCGQIMRMYFKLDLALDGDSVWNFMRVLEGESESMAGCFSKIAPMGSALRRAVSADVRRLIGEDRLQEAEIEALLSYAGFFNPAFQRFLRIEDGLAEARRCFSSAECAAGWRPDVGLLELLEATAKLIGLNGKATELKEIILDISEQCKQHVLTWKLYSLVFNRVRSKDCQHDPEKYGLTTFHESFKELAKASKVLQYKQACGAPDSLFRDVYKVLESILAQAPQMWMASFRSLDTVIFILEYMGKEDLQLAYSRFEGECKTHEQLMELIACVKKIYTQPLPSAGTMAPDMDMKDVMKSNKPSAPDQQTGSQTAWRGCTFGPADWQRIIDIGSAAANAMKAKYNVMMMPHHTQMITLLMFAIRSCGVGAPGAAGAASQLPRTMLARVGTGEGKSLIIGMLAAFIAKKGMRAHVVNNNRVLAQRDFATNDRFFQSLGIKASTDHGDLKKKECLIVYCTSDDVEGACLDCLVEGEVEQYEQGLKDAILIVDEVDGLIFDKGTNSSKFFQDREFSDWVNEWLSQLRNKGRIDRDWDDFRGYDECSRALQHEVEEAFSASGEKREGRDYTRRAGCLYMLDPKTKMIQDQGWSLWLEILKSQYNIPAKWVEYKYEKAVLSRLQCFMSYSCIFGLTGSLGRTAEKKYLGEHYEAVTFNVPFFLDTCRTEEGKVLGKTIPNQIDIQDPLPNQEAQDKAVIDLAIARCTDVPVLVVTKDTETVERLYKHINKNLCDLYGDTVNGNAAQRVVKLVHNPRNPEEFVQLVDKATEPLVESNDAAGGKAEANAPPAGQMWRVTVTTAEGGRGHDYRVVDPAIDEKGGLLLILTWVPWSEREWIQFIGRTGRQDHAGQFAVFLNSQDEQVKAAAAIRQPKETFIKAMLRHGDMETARMLQTTGGEAAKGKLMHRLTSKYWAVHKQDKTNKKQNWEWKRLCAEYTESTEEDIHERFKDIFPPVVIKWTDGQNYEGDLVDGKPHGYGVFTTGDGAIYEGQWDDGRRHGYGKYVDASGASYEGEWKANEQCGYGIEAYPDGARYEGDFLQGCKHGVGKYTSNNGLMYTGQFRRDKMDGEGHYEFASGRKYTGQWKRGQMDGIGKTVWPNGVTYEGGYEEDSRHGAGTVTWPDGRSYQGHWHKGRLTGNGVTVDANGVEVKGNGKPGGGAAAPGAAAAKPKARPRDGREFIQID